MIRIPCLLALCLSLGHAHPVTCTEDTQCLEGYYCEAPSYICRECVRCQEYYREASVATTTCTTSVDSCGHCFEGLVNIYGHYFKGICVPPESLQFQHLYFFGYLLAAVITLLIVVFFLYVLHHTDVFEVVDYDIAAQSQFNEESVVPISCGGITFAYIKRFVELMYRGNTHSALVPGSRDSP